MFVRRSASLLVIAFLALLAFAPAALADTSNIIEPQTEPPNNSNGWQAGTCLTDEPAPEVHCGPQTPGAFYSLASGHPPIGFTQYIVKHTLGTGKVEPAGIPFTTAEFEDPEGNQSIKTLKVDLPPGLTVNPNATPKCSLAEFENKVGEFHVPTCKEGTIVGREEITLATIIAGVPAPSPPFPAGNTLPKGFIIPPSESSGTKVPVYNLEPEAGEPALFGFVAAGKEVVKLTTEVSWESDFHESFKIELPKQEPPFATLVSRLVNFGQEAGNKGLVEEGNGTYINNPSTCFDPTQFENLYSTWFRAESYGEEDPSFPGGSTPFEAKVESSTGELIQQHGCETVPFEPGLEVDPHTIAIDSPASASVNTTLEYLDGEESEQQESHLRKAEVTLPAGMGLNPSGSVGLAACTDAQFKKSQRTYENECPAASKIGTIEIESPPLPAESLVGDMYVGEQQSSDPTSGNEFRILAEAKSEELGIAVRLIGHTAANPTTGQLTTTFTEAEVGPLSGTLPEGLPQVPFTSVQLHFNGVHRVLTTPPTCAPAISTSTMEPWSDPASTKHPSGEFTLSTDPAGGTCPTTLAARRFSPSYTAKTDNTQGGAYSPFRVHIGRTDGEQELKLANVTLPAGLAGKLAGTPYCSDAALSAAAANSGKAEAASPSCPAASKIGTASTDSGTGSVPAHLSGSAYLAGPYKGAPVSMAIVTPAVQGPFDLGTVVVRIALNVNPETTAVTAVSDVIPDVYGGVKLDIRSIDIDLDKSNFMHNPTNCDPKAVTGTLGGGGSDPTNPAAFSSFPFSTPYQASNCGALGFKPKLVTKLLGGRKSTKRRSHPKIQAILTSREGDANVARTALTLPPGLLLDNSHIGTVCVKADLAANTCPKNSVYGKASATSPLIEGPLSGNVYLVPSNSGGLPDLLADLRGQVNVQLRGKVSSSKNAGMRTVFNNPPDAPVTKFTLTMDGGKKGLLQNSKDLCKVKKLGSTLNIKGWNGKQIKRQGKNKLPLQISGCPKKKKK